MKKSSRLTLWELVLLLASVLVFRGVWHLPDQSAWASGTTGLVILLGVGLAVSVVALRGINRE